MEIRDTAGWKPALPSAARKAALGLLLLGLAASHLRAQEPDSPPPPPPVDAIPLDATNAAMQVEDLVSALRALQSEDPLPGEDAATNDAPAERSNRSKPGTPAPSYHKPSGRESRSRWSSRQRSNRSGSNDSSSASQPSVLTNTGPASLEFEAFRLIAQRNIFDPNRHPNRPTPPRDTPPSRDPVFFTLVGTMSYGDGTFAFFSGTSSQYQKALKCSGTIAGYTVSAIGQDAVTLTRDTNQVELRLGMQMRLNEDGTWTPSNPPTTYTVNDFQPASASSASSASGTASGGTESEILKRLMEKREKE